jgi:hypothetical protein
MRRSILVLSALAALAACNRGNTPPSPSSFDLPGDVSFGCVRLEEGDVEAAFVELSACRVEDDAADPATHSLIALVTQVATGEVAAVDVRRSISLDSQVVVPGFTYVRVGEIPTGIATIEPTGAAPSVTYVSTFGSRTIEAIETARFHPDVPESPTFPPTSIVDLPEGPTDLVFVPVVGDATKLGYVFAPMPAAGAIAQVAVSADGTLDGASLVVLPLDPDPLNALGPSSADEVSPYERVCPPLRNYVDATGVTPSAGPATASTPVKLEVDSSSSPPVLLVADETSPVIHRLEVLPTGAGALQGVAVDVPTVDLAVTPPVASDLDATSVDRRYVYAIDATDGSVLAVDYSPGSPTFGAILAVSVGTMRPDRIGYREPARAIEVITPELESFGTLGLCSPTEPERADDASPSALRGVFLTVALENGLVSVVDVWDLEATCRGGLDCQNPANSNDVEVAIRRHRPRLATFITERPVVTGAPSLSFETSPGLLDEQGEPSSGPGPGLAPVDCASEFTPNSVPGFPDDGTSLICLRDDPWAGVNQRFTAIFDGIIPLSAGGNGLLVDAGGGAFRFEAPHAAFCEVGVLGGADVTASALGPVDPEAGYGGDQLEITGDLPPDIEADAEAFAECEPFDLPNDGSSSDRDPIVFQVLAANQNELTVSALGDTDPAAILRCFPHPTAYRVRTRDAYMVAASGLPMRHRVVSEAGECRVDTATYPVVPGDPDSYRNFRAFPGQTFIHPLVAFEIVEREASLALGQESQLVFDVTRYPTQLALDLGAVPIVASMRWNAVDDRLYVVDEGQYQVAQIETDAFGILRFFD